MKINIGYVLYKRAQLNPDKEALVVDDVRRTWSELNERSNRAASALQKLDVKKGDRVAILAMNEPAYIELFFALGKIGVIMTPVNHRLAGPEIDYIVNNCEADILIFGPEFAEVVDGIRVSIPCRQLVALGDKAPDWAVRYEDLIQDGSPEEPELAGGGLDTHTILYTSGTTGRPKGAEITHEGYYANSVDLGVTLGDIGRTMLMPLPLFHIGALAPLIFCVHFGHKMIFQRTFEPAGFLNAIKTEGVSWFGSVPQMLLFLRSVPEFDTYDWSQIKMALVYAAPVPVTLLKEFAAKGMGVQQLYGMTEVTGPATVIDAENAIAKAGSCGLPFFHTDIRVVDYNDNDLPPGEIGEVLVRCTHPMSGYFKNPEATAATIKNGWLYSGDLAQKDEDGFLYIMDRKKDMIISGGENIYPAEVEDYLLSHPQVADVGVIGYADEKWGESVKAVVVLKKGETLSEADLVEWAKTKMGKFKVPKKIVFTEEIPRNPTGKILKRVLRDQYNS